MEAGDRLSVLLAVAFLPQLPPGRFLRSLNRSSSQTPGLGNLLRCPGFTDQAAAVSDANGFIGHVDPLLVQLQALPKEIVGTLIVPTRFPFEQLAAHLYTSIGESEGVVFRFSRLPESPVSNEVVLSISNQR